MRLIQYPHRTSPLSFVMLFALLWAAVMLTALSRWEVVFPIVGLISWAPQHYIRIPDAANGHQDHASPQYEVVTCTVSLHWAMVGISVTIATLLLFGVIPAV